MTRNKKKNGGKSKVNLVQFLSCTSHMILYHVISHFNISMIPHHCLTANIINHLSYNICFNGNPQTNDDNKLIINENKL